MAAVLALACGSQKTIPTPNRIGSVSLEASSTGLSKASTASFHLYPEPEALANRGCYTELAGDCETWVCDEQVYANPLELVPLSVGSVSVRGVSEPLLFTETTPGQYQAAAREGALWRGGDPLTLEIAGTSEFPAMQVSLRAPSLLSVVSQVGADDLVLKAGEDLSIAWSKSGGSSVYVMLSVQSASEAGQPIRTRALGCRFGPNLSSGVISSALLESLPKPQGFAGYRVDVFTSSFVELTQGDANLWFQAAEFGLSGTLTVESVP